MLFLHERHEIIGTREDDFVSAYRDGWMPTLAKGDDARLLYFMRQSYGTGPAYNFITVTAIRDGQAWESLVQRQPIGRMGSAEDIARGVVYLASDESDLMNGSELVLDGGLSAQ